jgi:hypothetical protein
MLMCLGSSTHLPHAAIIGTMILVNTIAPIIFFITSDDQKATEYDAERLHQKFVFVCANAIVLMLFVYIVYAVIFITRAIYDNNQD